MVLSYLGTIEDKYKAQKYYKEEINGVKVLRIRIPEFSKTNKKSRVKNIVSYFFGAMEATFKVGKMEYVLYYDLENLIKIVERFKPGIKTVDGREVVFTFVGAGSVLDKLALYVKKHRMDNVTFIPYQDKADLIYSLKAGDVHWCVNAKGIKDLALCW